MDTSSVSATPEENTCEHWRELKKRKTRQALVAAARSHILERGLDGVTVDEVCHDAGVSRRTFFNYFETKEDAFLDEPAPPTDRPAARIFGEGGPTGDLPQDILILAAALLKEISPRVSEFRKVAPAFQNDARLLARHLHWHESQMNALRDLTRTRIGPHADPARCTMIAFTVSTLIRGAMIAWKAAELQGTPADHLDQAAQQLRNHLLP